MRCAYCDRQLPRVDVFIRLHCTDGATRVWCNNECHRLWFEQNEKFKWTVAPREGMGRPKKETPYVDPDPGDNTLA